MYSDQDLQDAVQQGVLTQETAQAFRHFMAQRKQLSVADEESFRLLTGFNDVFVVIAFVLLVIASGLIGGALYGAAFIAVISWYLGEIFIKKRQMALPSIALFVAFVVGSGLAASEAFSALTEPLARWVIDYTHGEIGLFGFIGHYQLIVGGVVALMAARLHWKYFRVPIAVAGAAAALIVLIITLLPGNISSTTTQIFLFISGLWVFAAAMRWDLRDPARVTRNTDIAFWLHMLAAPLLVHPVFQILDFSSADNATLFQAIIVALLYIIVAFISLCIDRRALMISALMYVLFAFGELFRQTGMIDLGFAVAAFLVASGLLLLSIFWHRSRTFAIRCLPPKLQARLVTTL